jgi:two-component system, NarL family, sensor histidine kinase DesK
MMRPPPAPMHSAWPARWRSGWRRYAFPGIWLVFLWQVVAAVHGYAHGWAAAVGYAIVPAFGACYLIALGSAWQRNRRRFVIAYLAMLVLFVVETTFAHEQASAMLLYVAVLTSGLLSVYTLVAVGVLTLVAAFVPALVPAWHVGVQYNWLITIPLVGVAMWGFFSLMRSNQELAAARAEVARLAAENERTRIARDLHDLLGHSLSTITVKAGLARRLSERGEPERAAAEIAAVERLSRATLADVRAAVAGQRDITLAGELATAREVLRAAGILAELPGSVDIVDPSLSELFGWAVREGITNVVRHSRATHCAVSFGPEWIEIVDDGRGGMSDPQSGTGLVGLRERAAAAGGTVEVRPLTPGWRLRVQVPAT